MPHYIKWNKKHDKVKVYSTIVDGYITGLMTPEEMLNTEHKDLVLRDVFNKCPYCERPMELRIKSDYEQKVMSSK